MVTLLIVGLLFLGLSAAALLRAATMRRLRTAERLSAIDDYGFGAQSAAPVIRTETADTGLTGYVTKLGEAVMVRFGRFREEEIRAELMAAGVYSLSPRTFLGYRLLAATLLPVVVLMLGGFAFLPIVMAMMAVAAGWMIPLVLIRRRARLRLSAIDRRLPDLIDLLVVTIEAGLGFTGALRVAAENVTGSLRDELRLTLQEQTMGLSVEEALKNLAARADTANVRAFVRAMAQGERLGISIGNIMRNLALEMRKRRRMQADERAQKAPVKMLFPLVFLIFPSMLIVMLLPAAIVLVKTLGHA
jgi:tight adherence protein C